MIVNSKIQDMHLCCQNITIEVIFVALDSIMLIGLKSIYNMRIV